MLLKRTFALVAMIAIVAAAALTGCKKDATPVKSATYHVTEKWETSPDSSGGQDPPIPPKH